MKNARVLSGKGGSGEEGLRKAFTHAAAGGATVLVQRRLQAIRGEEQASSRRPQLP